MQNGVIKQQYMIEKRKKMESYFLGAILSTST
jgi:hypothetical protein